MALAIDRLEFKSTRLLSARKQSITLTLAIGCPGPSDQSPRSLEHEASLRIEAINYPDTNDRLPAYLEEFSDIGQVFMTR